MMKSLNCIEEKIKKILEDMSGGESPAPDNNTNNIEVQPDGLYPSGTYNFLKKKKRKNAKKTDTE